ncbi:ABC-2 type transporter-domain-containing protein [Thelonectria olida]|uniref:ABC-2 type transporter-domain-containing protein n=1 Tax=Thelonectria olida TaxID=1576542 RepID=A0A9P8VRP1_9HYPO|nr:ABC-2 type transporter-domain-containing protein [Thelonectria olida]
MEQTSMASSTSALQDYLLNAKSNGCLAGFSGKRIHLLFDGLNVRRKQTRVGGILDYLSDAAFSWLNTEAQNTKTAVPRNCLLQQLSGVVSPGEMVLILGRAGSGCTTFLKTVANNPMSGTETSGTLLYGGKSTKEFLNAHAGEAVFCGAEDFHNPTLTVEQTLQFALDLSVPKFHKGGSKEQIFKNDVLQRLLGILNISHTKTTMLGDARIRGVSGGERKRISIAEALITRAAIMCWENPTLGLDAATASELIRALRVLTSLYESVSLVSLYQASDTLYHCFDKVLLLADGHELYFGPADGAANYFKNLGFTHNSGQSIADFLAECADARLRTSQNPYSTADLARIFRESVAYRKMQQEMAQCQEEVRQEDYQRRVTECIETERYTGWQYGSNRTSIWTQISALARRHAQLRLQDRLGLIIKNVTSTIIALVCGSVYWQLPRTSNGTFTRGGVMFISLLYNAFSAFAELPLTILGRPILNKHTSFAFYRPSAACLGQIIFDIPLSALEGLIFSAIVYFMAGLRTDAGSFFVFYLFIIFGQIALTLFFRTLGCMSKTLDGALKVACVVIILFVLESGYLVPYRDQKPWVQWFSWVNPIAYSFEGLMANEFRELDLACSDSSFVPHGPGYSDQNYKICLVPGAVRGSKTVSGSSYLAAAFGFDVHHIWRNIAILLAFVVGLLIFNIIISESVTFVTSPVEMEASGDDDAAGIDEERPMDRHRPTETCHPRHQAETKHKTLSWSGMGYTAVVSKSESRQILQDISGYVKPGMMMALMGASGAGKSTLLDLMANRKITGIVSGTLLADGKPLQEDFCRRTAYCQQLDVHDPCQTVREALQFSAYLRQPASFSKAAKNADVEEIIHLLELQSLASSIIGEPETGGISLEQRKLVTIGVELAAKPDVLFLDEPTSGLSTQSAMNIVNFLRKLADEGKSIVCTIHQPNAAIFSTFSQLLLLHGGRELFCGPIAEAGQYFSHLGYSCPEATNFAEFMLEAISNGGKSADEWAQIWSKSDKKALMDRDINNIIENARDIHDISTNQGHSKSKDILGCLTFLVQLKTVSTRALKSAWRQPGYASTRIINHITIALLTALAYLNTGNAFGDLQMRIFIIFQVTILPSLVLSQVEPAFERAKRIFHRERASGMYSRTVFLTAMLLSEIPFTILCTVLFYLLLFFPANFSIDATKAGYEFFIVLITSQFSVQLGQTIAAFTPSSYIAALFTPFILITFSLFCGVTVPPQNIPKFWVWIFRSNPVSYLVGGLIETELSGLEVICKLSELYRFDPPAGVTCFEYLQGWLETAPGYLANENATSNCGYCPYQFGDDFIAQFGLYWDNRWRDLGILSAYLESTLVIYYSCKF